MTQLTKVKPAGIRLYGEPEPDDLAIAEDDSIEVESRELPAEEKSSRFQFLANLLKGWTPQQQAFNLSVGTLLLVLTVWSSLPRGGDRTIQNPDQPPVYNPELVRSIKQLPTVAQQNKDGVVVPGVLDLADGFLMHEEGQLIRSEAQRFLAAAYAEQRNKTNPNCFKRSLDQCLNSIEDNRLSAYQTAVAADDIGEAQKQLWQYKAIAIARQGQVSEGTLSPATFRRVALEVRERRQSGSALETELQQQEAAAAATQQQTQVGEF
jgi:hypothetical protein